MGVEEIKAQKHQYGKYAVNNKGKKKRDSKIRVHFHKGHYIALMG